MQALGMALVPTPAVRTYSPSRSASADGDKVSSYSLSGLHVEWDNVPEVRDRLREGQHVFRHVDMEQNKVTDGYVEKILPNVRANRLQLRPVLRLMSQHRLHLPSIDSLIEEVRALYRCSKVSATYDTLYHEAWGCRRLLSLAKNSLLYRKHLSEDGSCQKYL